MPYVVANTRPRKALQVGSRWLAPRDAAKGRDRCALTEEEITSPSVLGQLEAGRLRLVEVPEIYRTELTPFLERDDPRCLRTVRGMTNLLVGIDEVGFVTEAALVLDIQDPPLDPVGTSGDPESGFLIEDLSPEVLGNLDAVETTPVEEVPPAVEPSTPTEEIAPVEEVKPLEGPIVLLEQADYKVAELRELAIKLEIDTSGLKSELYARIADKLNPAKSEVVSE